jgi:outer membrane receptor protein involved in Fe transport
MSVSRRLILFLSLAVLALAPLAQAQVTTGGITGEARAADGSALPGVTIEAIHTPTGTRYDAVTGSNGRFVIPNVRVGGPYKVSATLEGFKPFANDRVTVPLGASADVPVTLQLETVSESITVTATSDAIINPNRTGATSAVSEEQIQTLPTVNRTIQDFARTNAYVNVDPQDVSSTRLYVAGKNNRYNSIAIDGAVNNDLFGLADTGTPGGQANALPISLDALQEIQVAVSPYDVRQGGFTGGGINVITRSGTNDWSGSAFYSKRTPELVGDGVGFNVVDGKYHVLDRNLVAREFEAEQYGGRFGGPVIKDKLFFFVNGEKNKRSEQGDFSGDTTIPGNSYKNPADLETVKNFLKSQFNYDAGTLGDIPQTSHSDNLFGRIDWNIGSSNQATLRHNYVKAANDVISDRNRNRFRFPTSIYAFADETNSTVAQLNSTFGGAYNEARVNYTTIRDLRDVPAVFPGIEIGGTGPRNADIIAGTEQFSGANGLDQDILEVTDDFTMLFGAHTVTVGTHNEFFSFKNLFLSSFYGHYYFPTMADFLALNPSQYFISYATGSDPRAATAFDVAQYGLYVNDQWTLGHNVTLTLGLRADKPKFEDSPAENPVVFNAVGVHSSSTASEDIVWSPRLGFNWQITPGQQLRGGIGSFAGRTPYVWISNSYGGTGIGTLSITCAKPSCTPTFVADPLNQPKTFPAGSAAFEADITDPDFDLPHVLRATLGYDRELPWGIRGTVEALWSKVQSDVYYQNLNFIPTGAISPLDGRPLYKRNSTALSQAILLTSTDKGQQTMESLQLNKNFGRFMTLATSYTHQEATSAFDGTSSTALSQWRFHHTTGDIYTPELSRSAFETEHRFNIAATFNFDTAFISHSIGLFYNAQSGRPYSLLFGNDVNGDTQSTNDLIYVADPNSVIIRRNAGSTWTGDPNEQYKKYLEYAGIDSFGHVLKRYDLTEPWTRQLDLHYELGLPAFMGVRTMIIGDMLNVMALVNEDSGITRYVANQNFAPFNYSGIDAATGKPIYTERAANTLAEGSQFSVATDRSRWQARLGVRVSF